MPRARRTVDPETGQLLRAASLTGAAGLTTLVQMNESDAEEPASLWSERRVDPPTPLDQITIAEPSEDVAKRVQKAQRQAEMPRGFEGTVDGDVLAQPVG